MGGRVGGLFLRRGPHNKLGGMDSEIVFESRFISVSRRTGIRESDDRVLLVRGKRIRVEEVVEEDC